MKIYVISAAVAIVFVVTSANANKVPQNTVENNQSRPPKPSAILRSDKINFRESHIEASQEPTATTSVGGTAAAQPAITANEAEEYVDNKHIIIQPKIKDIKMMCPDGYTLTVNGDCTPKFPDN